MAEGRIYRPNGVSPQASTLASRSFDLLGMTLFRGGEYQPLQCWQVLGRTGEVQDG